MENQPKKNNTNKAVLVLLILSLIGNLFQWRNTATTVETYDVKVDSLVQARVDVERELGETYAELNKYQGINANLDSLLSEANGKIDEQKARIDQLLRKERNSTTLNKKLMAEIAELQKLRDEYLEKIDQLLVENQQLKKDKEDLTNTVDNLTRNLQATVNTASVLKSEYIQAKSYKKRSSGKYTETAIARRTNKLEACFTLLDNKIATSGSKTVYLRVVEPGGKTLGQRSEGSSKFTLAGTNEEVMYTSSKSIDFDGNKQNVCLNWEEDSRVFSAGTYVVEIYVEGALSGASSIILR